MGKKISLKVDHPYPMSVFEVAKKDKSGRIINSEDEEARSAAREHRRQRDEESKARRKSPTQEQKAPQNKPKMGVRSGEVVKTGNAMPNTQFKRPNPLGDGEEIMDATARLLAPKTTNNPTQGKGNSQEKPRRQSNRNQRNFTGEAGKSSSHVVKQNRNKGQRPRHQRGEFEDLPHTTGVKDSTEQSSLMKPFYLDFKR